MSSPENKAIRPTRVTMVSEGTETHGYKAKPSAAPVNVTPPPSPPSGSGGGSPKK